MRPARHVHLLNKAVDAAIAAIEVYNKPSFCYREEAFSILMLNAWELLLKARVLKESGNKMRAIEHWEPVRRADGTPSAYKHRPKRNRSGNNMTIGMFPAAAKVRAYGTYCIDEAVISNLEVLQEIRDNAIHLVNKGRGLQKLVQEVGTASLRNFATAASSWFGKDLSAHNFAIMPLIFQTPQGALKAAFDGADKGAAGNLFRLISEKQKAIPFDADREFNVSVEIDVKLKRTTASTPGSIHVHLGPDVPGAIPFVVKEEDVLAAYPWDYSTLVGQLSKRYSDLMLNSLFYRRKAELEADARFCKVRLLDPRKPNGSKKRYYSPNILPEFDDLYARKLQPPKPPSPVPVAVTASGAS